MTRESSPKVLLVVPPFAALNKPYLACHLLQACAREAGFSVDVRYANLEFGRAIGALCFNGICYGASRIYLGEQLFARRAYGVEPSDDLRRLKGDHLLATVITDEDFAEMVAKGNELIDALAAQTVAAGYDIVGCSSTFTQTAAALAMLKEIKARSPRTVTLMGGGNCEGEMAEGILGLAPWLDYVFSGESDITFVEFLRGFVTGRVPGAHSIIRGEVLQDLDPQPLPDFTEYFEQFQDLLPGSLYEDGDAVVLPYQSSRGCWWGAKHHCTFCGVNGEKLIFRQKSPDKVLADLKALVSRHPGNQVCMVDSIMPFDYFSSLLPAIAREIEGISIFYEQKANLSLDRVVALKNAGVKVVQAGIESLSTPLLELMDKGTTASRNLRMLRYARSVGMEVAWNVLHSFPGDRAAWYEAMNDLLDRIHHLYPPMRSFAMTLDRFSPYFMRPESYGIRNLRPRQEYFGFLPTGVDVSKIAYHFSGDFDSQSAQSPEILGKIADGIEIWREQWSSTDLSPPVLLVEALEDGRFALYDTRGLSDDEAQVIDEDRARLVLAGAPLHDPDDELQGWAVDAGYCLPLDGLLAPLAVAEPELLRKFEASSRQDRAGTRAGDPRPRGPRPVASS